MATDSRPCLPGFGIEIGDKFAIGCVQFDDDVDAALFDDEAGIFALRPEPSYSGAPGRPARAQGFGKRGGRWLLLKTLRLRGKGKTAAMAARDGIVSLGPP